MPVDNVENLPSGESDFTFYDITESRIPEALKALVGQKVTFIVESIGGEGWRPSKKQPDAFVRDLHIGIKGSEAEDGERLGFKAYLTAGCLTVDKYTKKLKAADVLLKMILSAAGVTQQINASNPTKGKAEYANHIKSYVDEYVLPSLGNAEFEGTFRVEMDAEYGEKVNIKSLTPGQAVTEARRAAFAKAAGK